MEDWYVSIKCGIFQGDSLSTLLFIMSLFPLSSILNGLIRDLLWTELSFLTCFT